MKTYFDLRNDAVGIVETANPDEGMLELLPEQSRLGSRYAIEDGQVVDMYPGKTDEEVMEAIRLANEALASETPSSFFISKYAFMERFTDQELVDIYTAAKTEVRVEVWMDKLKLVTEVDLLLPRTQEGVTSLETLGLIQPGRALEILEVPAV